MKRTWVVRPDTDEGTVSREAMTASLLDAEALLARAGGVLTVIVQRHPTDFPGEMVTTAAVFEWKDRTDARPQPETQAPLVPLVEDPTPEQFEDALAREEALGAGLQAPEDPDAEALGRLEEEDVSDIPASVR